MSETAHRAAPATPAARTVGLAIATLVALSGAYFSREPASPWLLPLTYGCTLAALALLVLALVRAAPALVRPWRERSTDLWGAALVVIATLALLAHEPAGFKAVEPELALARTAQAWHHAHPVSVAAPAGPEQTAFDASTPVLFPLLVSLLHDVTGYRPENAFFLNAVLLFALLALSYVAGRLLAGRWGGVFAIAAWAAQPVLAWSARGGGDTLLGVVVLLATALLAVWHWRNRDGRSLVALLSAAVLLTQTRIHAPLPLLAVVIVVIAARRTSPTPAVPLLACVCPLLAWPAFRAHSWTTVFDGSHFNRGLDEAFLLWFGSDPARPNASWVAAAGVLAIGGAIAITLVRARAYRGVAKEIRILWLFGVAALVLLALRLGNPGVTATSGPAALQLVDLLIFALAPVFCLGCFRNSRPLAVTALGALALWIIVGLPTVARRGLSEMNPVTRELAARRDFLRAHEGRTFSIVDHEPNFWRLYGISADSVQNAPQRTAGERELFVLQRCRFDPERQLVVVEPADDLGAAFTLVPVQERLVELDRLVRISRVERVTPSAAAATVAVAGLPAPDPRSERVRLEQWLSELP